nr:IS5 family transposase [Paracoccus sp. S1E-3]
MVAPGCVCPDLCRACTPGAGWRCHHDRQHAPQGSPDGGKPLKRGTRPRAIGRTKGGLNSKLHMICDGLGRPLTFFLSPGQMSDAKGALALLRDLPPARTLLADKGYDADWFRQALEDRGIAACIPARRGRRNPASHDRKLYRQRHRIENLFARLKDWRRIATRYDRCGELFLSAICIAATVMFWL